jgi:predicted CXXCH cytochrome family protein
VAAVFSRRANTVFAIVLAALATLLAVVIATPMILIRTPYGSDRFTPVPQPVAFDHRHHVRDDAIDCIYCHSAAESSASAGIPTTELCMGCHSQIWPDSQRLEPVRRSWQTGAAIGWQRVYDLPDHVYFHHGVHVRAGVACAHCHGDIGNMARVQRVTPLTMKWCLDCHRADRGRAITAITTCSACHR